MRAGNIRIPHITTILSLLICVFFHFSSHALTAAHAIDFVVDTDPVIVPEGGTATFTVTLSEQPNAFLVNVTVRHQNGDSDISVQSGNNLFFNQVNWNVPQTVTLAAAQDEDEENGTARIRINASGINARNVIAVESDDDIVLSFVTNTDTVTVPEGGTATFQVRLNADPGETVEASVARISGDDDISLQAGSTLTFTGGPSGNWNTPQVVTLGAAEDPDAGDGSATFRVRDVAGVLDDADVVATEADNDTLTFVTTPASVDVPEGGSATFTVSLSADPQGPVTASIARVSGDSDITASPTSLTFTGGSAGNWSTPQAVTLSAAEDPDADNGTATILVSASGIPDNTVNAAEADNDGGITFVTDTEAITVPEGGTATFQVRLSNEPEGAVSASVGRTGGDVDISVREGSTLIFDRTNWDIFQTVTLAAAEDEDGIDGVATVRVSDTNSAIPDRDLTATEADNDTIFVTVLSPNGGETWVSGTSHDITWQSTEDPGTSVSITLTKGGAENSPIIPSTPDDGSFSWAIPPEQEVGDDYRVRITSALDPSVTDESDADFSIVGRDEDTDSDGVPDTEEMGPEGNDPEYSGNLVLDESGNLISGDLIPDSLQDTVTSLHTLDRAHYVTLEGSGRLSNVAAVSPPLQEPGAPQNVSFPYGFFAFTTEASEPGGPATVILYTDGENADSYHKFGATPDDQAPHWYEFFFDPETVTGAEFDGFLITLHFVDGLTGDDDLLQDGSVTDQGGPGVTVARTAEEAGSDCFIATAVFGSTEAPYVRLLRDFRDTFLLTNGPGRWIVKNYYRYSPRLARWLAGHGMAKSAARLLLTPVIILAWLLQSSGLMIPLVIAAALFLLPIGVWRRGK